MDAIDRDRYGDAEFVDRLEFPMDDRDVVSDRLDSTAFALDQGPMGEIGVIKLFGKSQPIEEFPNDDGLIEPRWREKYLVRPK
jgi:hypothetical protein